MFIMDGGHGASVGKGSSADWIAYHMYNDTVPLSCNTTTSLGALATKSPLCIEINMIAVILGANRLQLEMIHCCYFGNFTS